MSADFDAYHKWLGIPPEEQPPNHYRLLGVKAFESDPDVIESTADQRMIHLRTFQAGKHGAHSQKLLNEVATAKVCLLNKEQKTAYDAQLKQKLTPAKLPAAKPLPKAAPLTAQPLTSGPSPTRGEGSKAAAAQGLPNQLAAVSLKPTKPAKASTGGIPLWMIGLGGVVAVSFLILVVVIAMSGGGGGPPVKPNGGNANLVAEVPKPPSVPPRPPVPIPTPPTPKAPVTNPPAPVTPPDSPAPPMPVVNPAPLAPVPMSAVTPATGKTTELLPLVDTQRHTVKGDWYFDGRAVTVEKTALDSVLQIPYAPPAEYDLLVVVQRNQGLGCAIGLAGPANCSLGFDFSRSGSFLSGIAFYKGAWIRDHQYQYKGRLISPTEIATLVIRVRNSRLQVERNGVVVMDWEIDWRECSMPADHLAPNPRQLSLIAVQSSPRFARVAITEVGPSDVPVAAATSDKPTAPVPTAHTDNRRPIPSEEETAPVRTKLAEIYAGSPKLTAAQKLKQVSEYMRLADESREAPVDRYVLLREAQKLAVEAGDPDFSLRITATIGGEYRTDVPAEGLKVVTALATVVKDDAAIAQLVEKTIALAEQAIAQQKAEPAQQLLEAIVRQMPRPPARRFVEPYNKLKTAAADAVKQHKRLELARQTLATTPEDPGSNLVLGAWHCFSGGDWKTGLAHLAKAGDPRIAACVERESQPSPEKPDDQLALADLWWDAAEKGDKDFRASYRSRAVYWYEKALPGISSGLAKAKAEKRIADAGPQPTVKSPAAPEAGPKPTGRARRLLIISEKPGEQRSAQDACGRFGLTCDMVADMDSKHDGFPNYGIIILGSNIMDYWAGKPPTAFDPLEQWVKEGGHLIVLGAWNGRNCENLARFGVVTSTVHADTFKPAGEATKLLFQGVEEVVPTTDALKSVGSIKMTVSHDALLLIGTGPREGDPAVVTRAYDAGRFTHTLVEPYYKGEHWITTALISWSSRGCPVP